ncbi:hypothetical protein BDV98DRAFT_23511 [Pterulicium gracile]|uniref:WW domain-containing protein n=1 Tax=Pterulicium gracile TaxID=1884261 RepID=A0A5C3R1C9_9AGAR|nr:hypothetical protein BDV98DRAFT_23511 [Pterula gracilis]
MADSSSSPSPPPKAAPFDNATLPEPENIASPSSDEKQPEDQSNPNLDHPHPVDPSSRSDSAAPSEQGKDDEENADQQAQPSQSPTEPNPWQAIWSPQHNAYYFYNSGTQETTWINPLQPPSEEAEASSSKAQDVEQVAGPSQAAASSSNFTPQSALYAAALAQGIDPSLAHLDPTLAALSGQPSSLSFTAKFNARTGAFARPDSRDPSHLSEFERAKRMSEFYFDVNAWQQDLEKTEAAEAEEGKKRKRPTKSDLVRLISPTGS